MAMTIDDLAKQMAEIDFCMLNTKTEGGEIAARPMSNNGEVAWRGDSYFFSLGDTRTVEDIRADPKVGLSFQGKRGLLGQRPFMVAVEGHAELIRDKAAFEKHWTKDIDRWFPDGIDTPGLTLIAVRAQRIHYWDGEDEGEIVVDRDAAVVRA
jgi:general stress protein 26